MSINKYLYYFGFIISILSLICIIIYNNFVLNDFINIFLTINFIIGIIIIIFKKIRLVIFSNYLLSIIVIYSFNIFLYFNDIRKIQNATIFNQVVETENERKKGKDIWPAITPSYILNKSELDIYPLGSFINKSVILCDEDEKINIKTDKFGFNNNDEVYNYINPNVILGDSYGFGGCVNHKDDFSFLLNKLGLKNINMSISGSSIIVQTAIFKEYVKEGIDFKNIFLFLNLENDIPESRNEYNSFYIKYLDETYKGQDLINKPKEINKFYVEQLKNIKEQSLSLSFFRQFIFKRSPTRRVRL